MAWGPTAEGGGKLNLTNKFDKSRALQGGLFFGHPRPGKPQGAVTGKSQERKVISFYKDTLCTPMWHPHLPNHCSILSGSRAEIGAIFL